MAHCVKNDQFHFQKKDICIMRGKTTWANTSASTCYCRAFFLLPNSKALALSSSNMSNIMDDALMRLIVGATIAVRLRFILSTFVIPSDPSVIFHLNHHHSSSLICLRCLEKYKTNPQMVVFPWWFTMAESVKNQQPNKSPFTGNHHFLGHKRPKFFRMLFILRPSVLPNG